MGLSRRVKFKFKFSRKYNTNVYNFFTKKKSTRKVFEEKYIINFLEIETASVKEKLFVLMQKLWFMKNRQRKLVFENKKFLTSKIFCLKRKAKTLFFLLFYIHKKQQQQQKLFKLTKIKSSFFIFFDKFPHLCVYKVLNFFFLILPKTAFYQVKKQKLEQNKSLINLGFYQKVSKEVLFQQLVGFLKKKNKNKKLKRFFRNTRLNLVFFKTRLLYNKLQNVFFFHNHFFRDFLFKNKNFYIQQKELRKFKSSSVLFTNIKLSKKPLFLRKSKKINNFLFFFFNKKKKTKKIINLDLYRRESFEIAWFIFDLLQNFYLYEKMQVKIFNEFKLLFIRAFPIFSLKMRRFLLKNFFKTKKLFNFKYNQRAPRVFEFFFSKLQRKYGFKTMDVPFRLDVPLPHYKIKKQTEKLKMYKALKITRRNYGNLSQKFFWKIRKKVYNKTKGYAFFNQLLFYESRLDVFLMRARLCDSLQDARGFIFKGWICVNGKQIYNLNYIVTLSDIVSVFCKKILVFKHFFLNKCLQLLKEYSSTIGKIFPKYLESDFLNMAFCYVPKVFSLEKIPGQFVLNKIMVTNWGKFAY